MTADRRRFLQLLGAGVGTTLAACSAPGPGLDNSTGRRVVVVGGGYGGTIAAKTIRMLDPSIEVVLVEPNRRFVSCPFSNLYIGGVLADLSSLTIGYDTLVANHGIKLVHDTATAVDPVRQTITLTAATIHYDRLVLSPGIDFRTEELEGYDLATTPQVMPHAWKGGLQTQLLRRQLLDMQEGGTVVMTVPLTPFRCPAAPYERASMIALYLKQHKPKSRIVILDANPDIAFKAELFSKAWNKNYEGIVQYRGAQQVTAVDAAARAVFIEGMEEVRGDVVNVIPPQRAGRIASAAGLIGADKAWCPVDGRTFESTLQRNIHVIGDACNAGAMPKSGDSANSQARLCASNVVALMNGRDIADMWATNTCFSFLSAGDAVSVTGWYTVQDGQIVSVPDSGGTSPDRSDTEATHASSWLKKILTEMST